MNPFVGTAFSWPAIGLGCLGALPIFLVSVLLEKSGVDFFRKIDQDTKLYVVQVFGAKRNWPVRVFPAMFRHWYLSACVCMCAIPDSSPWVVLNRSRLEKFSRGFRTNVRACRAQGRIFIFAHSRPPASQGKGHRCIA